MCVSACVWQTLGSVLVVARSGGVWKRSPSRWERWPRWTRHSARSPPLPDLTDCERVRVPSWPDPSARVVPSLVPGEPGPEQDLEKLPRTGFLQEIPTSRHDLLYPSEAPWRESHGFTDDVRPADPGTPSRGNSAAARLTSTWPHRSHADSRGAARRPANLHQLDRNQSAHWRRCKYFNILTISLLFAFVT